MYDIPDLDDAKRMFWDHPDDSTANELFCIAEDLFDSGRIDSDQFRNIELQVAGFTI